MARKSTTGLDQRHRKVQATSKSTIKAEGTTTPSHASSRKTETAAAAYPAAARAGSANKLTASTGVKRASASPKKVPQISKDPAVAPTSTANPPAPAPTAPSTCAPTASFLDAAKAGVTGTKSTTTEIKETPVGTKEVRQAIKAKDADVERQLPAPERCTANAQNQEEHILAEALSELDASQLKVQELEQQTHMLESQLCVKGETVRNLREDYDVMAERLVEETKARIAASKALSARDLEVKELKQQLAAAAEERKVEEVKPSTAIEETEHEEVVSALISERQIAQHTQEEMELSMAALQKDLAEAKAENLTLKKERASAAAERSCREREFKKLQKQLASRDAQLAKAKTQCEDIRSEMRTKEADLEAAIQANKDSAKALEKEREESARRKAFAARQTSVVAAKDQEIAQLKTAAQTTEELAARATAQCAAAQQSARRAETAREAAVSRAASADLRTAAALRLVRAAQERIRSLMAESSAKENTILELQGRLMDLGSAAAISSAPAVPEDPTPAAYEPAPAPSAPATPERAAPAAALPRVTPSAPAAPEAPAQAASGAAWSAPASWDHPLLQLPEDAPAKSTATVVFSVAAKACVALRKACLPAWLPV